MGTIERALIIFAAYAALALYATELVMRYG